MQEWKNFVPNEHQEVFKEKFAEIVVSKLDTILADACYHGTHHSSYNCPDNGCEDYCLDDSDERDIKDSAKKFYSGLWRQVFESMSIKPKKRQNVEEDHNNNIWEGAYADYNHEQTPKKEYDLLIEMVEGTLPPENWNLTFIISNTYAGTSLSFEVFTEIKSHAHVKTWEESIKLHPMDF